MKAPEAAGVLSEISMLLEVVGGDPFRAKAYATAAASPIAAPVPARISPSPRTRPEMLDGAAPRAIRKPNSRTR